MLRTFHLQPFATFRGLRYIPILAVTRNSLFPSLDVEGDSLRIRVIREHVFKLDEIERITLHWRLAYQLTMVPKRGCWTYSANFLPGGAARAVTALRQHAAPLDASALEFLREYTERAANTK